jgi:hypothetical protein
LFDNVYVSMCTYSTQVPKLSEYGVTL